MIFGLFGAKSQASCETNFWNWFSANETRLFSFESDQELIFDELGAEMHKVNPNLTFEFGPVVDGKREFVLSAGGIKSAFPFVEALYKNAPTLERWSWIKFCPRRTPLNNIEFEDKSILVEDVHYLLARDETKVAILLFFDGYNEEEKNIFGQIGFLFLDEALGEFSVEMQVGFIEFKSRDSKYFERALPLKELPVNFDKFWAKIAH